MKKTKLGSKTIKLACLAPMFFALASCNTGNIKNIVFTTDNNKVLVGELDLSKYKIKVDYKNGISEEITVTEDMIDKDDYFKLYQVGTHDIKFYYDNFYTSATFIVELNHFDESISFKTNDTYNDEKIFTQKYDGKPHSLELTSNIPDGTTIIYPDGNSFTEVKNTPYEVKAILTKDGYVDKEIVGKIRIVVSDFPSEQLDKIVFEDKVATYDGREKTVECENIPEELDVQYKIFDSNGRKVENAVDAGVYTVTATFTSKNPNYSLTDDKKTRSAKLTIEKSSIKIDTLTFEDINKVYDGESVNINPIGFIPDGISCDVKVTDINGVEVTDPKDVGTYNVEIFFVTDNNHFATPESITGHLNIIKKSIDLSSIQYGLQEVTYDGEPKAYTLLNGQLESFIKANLTYTKYETGEIVENPTEPGKYIVSIAYEVINENNDNFTFTNIPSDPATLVINGTGE